MSNYSDKYCSSVKDIIDWVGSDFTTNQEILQDWKQAVETAINNPELTLNDTLNGVFTNTLYIPVIFHLIHMGEQVGQGMNLEYSFVPNLLNKINQKISSLNIKLIPAKVDPNKNILNEPGLERINGSTLNRSYYDPDSLSLSILYYNYVTHGVAHTPESSEGIIPGILEDTIKQNYNWNTNRFFNIYIVNSLNDKTINQTQKLLGSSTMPFISEYENKNHLFGMVMPVKSLGISETIPLLFDYYVGQVRALQSISYDCKNISDYYNFVNSLDGNSFIHNLLHCFGLIDIHFPAIDFGCNVGKSGDLFTNIRLGGGIYNVNNSWEKRFVEDVEQTNSCELEMADLSTTNSPTLISESVLQIPFHELNYKSSEGTLSASFSADDNRTYEFYDHINQQVLQEGSYSYSVTSPALITDLLDVSKVSTFITTSSELPTEPLPPITYPTFRDYLPDYGGYYAGEFDANTISNVSSNSNWYNDAIVNAFTNNALLENYFLIVSYSYSFVGQYGTPESAFATVAPTSITNTNYRIASSFILPWLNKKTNNISLFNEYLNSNPNLTLFKTHIENHNGLGDWDFPWLVEAEHIANLDTDQISSYQNTGSNDIFTKNSSGSGTYNLDDPAPTSIIDYETTGPDYILIYKESDSSFPIRLATSSHRPNSVLRVVRRVPKSKYEADQQQKISDEIANTITTSSSINISHHGYNIQPKDVQNINISYNVTSLDSKSIDIENLFITINYKQEVESSFANIANHPMHHSFLSSEVTTLSSFEKSYVRACFGTSYILESLLNSFALQGQSCSNGGFFTEYNSILSFDAYINSSEFSLNLTLDNVLNLSNNQDFINQYSSRIQNFNTTLSTITQNFLDG